MKLDDPASLVLSAVGRLPVILFAFDRDERFVMSEGGGLAGLGRAPGEVVGRTLSEVYSHVPTIVDAVRRALRGETVEASVVLGAATFQASYQPLFVEGVIQGAIGVAFDVSERRRSEQLLESVIEESTDAIVLASRDGRILRFNPAAERMFGHRAFDVVGRNLTLLMPADYRDLHTAGLARYADTGEARVLGRWVRLSGLRADGSHVHLDLHLSEVQRQDDPVFLGVMRDATEDEALRRAREHLVASVSHEFRTPLAAISLFGELIRSTPDVPADVAGHLDVIDRNIQRLTRLVEDLLLFGEASGNQFPAIRETIDLTDVIAVSVASARAAASARHISLSFAPVPGPALEGDAVRLGQVFDNLLNNAVKFTPEGGAIDVRSEAGESAWVVTIANSGALLRPGESETLFEPFARGADAVAAGVPGSGLGLAIVRSILDRLGGTVAMTRGPGGRTMVTVTLPLHQQHPADAQP